METKFDLAVLDKLNGKNSNAVTLGANPDILSRLGKPTINSGFDSKIVSRIKPAASPAPVEMEAPKPVSGRERAILERLKPTVVVADVPAEPAAEPPVRSDHAIIRRLAAKPIRLVPQPEPEPAPQPVPEPVPVEIPAPPVVAREAPATGLNNPAILDRLVLPAKVDEPELPEPVAEKAKETPATSTSRAILKRLERAPAPPPPEVPAVIDAAPVAVAAVAAQPVLAPAPVDPVQVTLTRLEGIASAFMEAVKLMTAPRVMVKTGDPNEPYRTEYRPAKAGSD